MSSRKIYLDYAASTPVDSNVLKAMMPYFSQEFGNPGSIHSFGQTAMNAVDEARALIAKAVNADFREIIFTGSATESNNIAFRGITRKFTRNYAEAFRDSQRGVRANLRPKLIVSAIEHESVLDTARDLKNEGADVVFIPVDKNGIVDVKKIEEALDERTVLVSVMCVNNEIGSVQSITEIAETVRNFRNSKHEARNPKQISNSKFENKKRVSDFGFRVSDLGAVYPLLHTDAAQAFGYFDCNVQKSGVDLMTLSGQKIYGPKGIGALYARSTKFEARNPKQISNSKFENKKRVSDFGFRVSDLPLIAPMVTGGGQEFGLRSGTENVPAIVGFGKAVEMAVEERTKNSKNVAALKEYFWKRLKKFYPEAEENGQSGTPHILNIYFPTEYAGELLVKLDMNGVAASAGSACSARSFMPSYVLQAIGLSQERVRGSLRFSFGKMVTKEEISEVLQRIKKILNV